MTTRPTLALISDNPEAALKGDLVQTQVPDLLQFLSSHYDQGMVEISNRISADKGKIYFASGQLLHAETDGGSGMDALIEVLGWSEGTFRFHPDITAPGSNIGIAIQHAIMEAAVLSDHRVAGTSTPNDPLSPSDIAERSNNMQPLRESTEILNDLLGIPGVDAVVVIGRDGFVIESAGNSTRVNSDALGASLAHAVNGIEEMGGELKIDLFQDMFIEYGKAVILCKPMGDAVAAVITPDASKLGIIRHKTKKYFHELAESF